MMWWLLLTGAAGGLGLALLGLGVRGRRLDTHPWCRKCRYDLSGAGAAPAVCPECGSDLARRRSVGQGRRRRSPLLVVPGGLLLLLAVAGAGTMLWPKARAFDWYTVKPAWLLAWEAESGSAGRARAARNELIGRIETGRLSGDRIESLVETALAVQADPGATWSGQWGTMIEAAWYVDRIDDDVLRRYLRNAFVPAPALDVQPRARSGGTISLGVHVPQPRGAEGTSLFEAHFWFVEARLGDRRASLQRSSRGHWTLVPARPVMPQAPAGSGAPSRLTLVPPSLRPPGTGTGAGSRWYDAGVAAVAEPGRHEITVTCAIAIVPGRPLDPDPGQRTLFSTFSARGGTGEGRSSGGSNRREAPEDALFQWPIALAGTVEIVPEDVEVVELVADAALREAVEESITIEEVELRLSARGMGSCSVRVLVSDPPIDLIFDIVLRIGDTEVEFMNRVICRSGQTEEARLMGIARGVSTSPETVDVHLRPAPRAAEDLVNMNRIWGEAIILVDVPADSAVQGRTSRRPVPKGRAGPSIGPLARPGEDLDALIAETRAEDPREAARAIRRLEQRVEELPAERLAEMVEEALQRQADHEAEWNPEWGSFIESAMFAGLLDEDQTGRYLRQAIDGAIDLVVRPRVRPGARSPFAVRIRPRAGGGRIPRLAIHLHPVGAVVGDPPEALEAAPAGAWSLRGHEVSSSLRRRRTGSFGAAEGEFAAPGRPGRHELVLDYELRVVAGGRGGTRRYGARPGPAPEPADPASVLFTGPLELRAPFEVIDAEASSVALDETEACRAAVEAAVRVDAITISLDPAEPDRATVRVQVRVGPLDVGLSYRAFLRIAGREIPAGRLVRPAGLDSMRSNMRARLEDSPDVPLDTVDLILRPDPEAVERTLEIVEIAGHEIVRESLPVEYESPRDR